MHMSCIIMLFKLFNHLDPVMWSHFDLIFLEFSRRNYHFMLLYHLLNNIIENCVYRLYLVFLDFPLLFWVSMLNWKIKKEKRVISRRRYITVTWHWKDQNGNILIEHRIGNIFWKECYFGNRLCCHFAFLNIGYHIFHEKHMFFFWGKLITFSYCSYRTCYTVHWSNDGIRVWRGMPLAMLLCDLILFPLL